MAVLTSWHRSLSSEGCWRLIDVWLQCRGITSGSRKPNSRIWSSPDNQHTLVKLKWSWNKSKKPRLLTNLKERLRKEWLRKQRQTRRKNLKFAKRLMLKTTIVCFTWHVFTISRLLRKGSQAETKTVKCREKKIMRSFLCITTSSLWPQTPVPSWATSTTDSLYFSTQRPEPCG